MFEGLINDARAPRGALLASICVHGAFFGLATAITSLVKPRSAPESVEVMLVPPPRPTRFWRPPVAPRVRPEKLVQPRAMPTVMAKPLRAPRPPSSDHDIDEEIVPAVALRPGRPPASGGICAAPEPGIELAAIASSSCLPPSFGDRRAPARVVQQSSFRPQ